MEKYDVVIIGSGLGGLQCGYILSKHGLKVAVLEKNARPGGCLQTFRRGRHLFDTGFHYVGGLDGGQPLNVLFRYFGLMDLPWRRMDSDGFDEVILNGKSYLFANGYERFADTLAAHFPHQRQQLRRYAAFLENVSGHIFDVFRKKNFDTSLFEISACDYLASAIDDPTLRNVLSATSLKMELHPRTLPLYTFAQINASFIQSAWRLPGGGSQIAESLCRSIAKNGGAVRTNAEVTRLVEANGRIAAAEIRGMGETERIEATCFIAGVHPAVALSLVAESAVIRNIYRKRISRLENTFGMFTANIALKDNVAPYRNRNIYVYETGDVWQYAVCKPENENTCALISFQPSDSEYTRNIDILTPMYWQEVERWADTAVGRRGSEYLAFKERKAAACIRLLSSCLPEWGAADADSMIEHVYTGTPLSYRDYTASPCGSAYGIRKNCEQLMTTLLSPRTPVPNLFLTGQNLNLHGLLGVSMTSFLTCAEITGMDAALEGLF